MGIFVQTLQIKLLIHIVPLKGCYVDESTKNRKVENILLC